jgi:hypothetical protein
MVKQRELYVYSMFFGRFDQECIKFKVDPAILVDFLAMPREVQEDFTDEWDEDLDGKHVSGRVLSLLSETMYGDLEAKDKKKLLLGQPFYMMTEEHGYGFGYTKEDAMLAYTKGEQDNGAFDEGQNDW